MTSRRILPALLLLFIGSGCAALIYEIVWFQLLQLVVGSSAISLGVLLGTFMGGMCLVSLALSRAGGQGVLLLAGRRAPTATDLRRAADQICDGVEKQLGADAADRFAFRFGLANTPHDAFFVYQLDVSLFYDGKGSPVRAGRLVMALPTVPDVVGRSEIFYREDHASGSDTVPESSSCADSNAVAAANVLKLAGRRSIDLPTGFAPR